MKRAFQIALKAAGSLGFAILLLTWIDLGEIRDAFRDVVPGWMAAYVALGVLGVLVSAWKWQILAAAKSQAASVPVAFALYLRGIFFSQFLPTGVGGDAVRAWDLGRRRGNDTTAAVASVFVERYTGLVVLIAYAVLAIPFDDRLISAAGVLPLLLLAIAALGTGTWIVADDRALAWGERHLPGAITRKVAAVAARVQRGITAYRGHGSEVLIALVLSVLFHAIAVVSLWASCRAVGHALPLSSAITALPLILLVFLVPFSIGGIGLQEFSFTAVLALVGVPAPTALAVGLLFRARTVLFALAGAATYLGGGRIAETGTSAAGSKRPEPDHVPESRI